MTTILTIILIGAGTVVGSVVTGALAFGAGIDRGYQLGKRDGIEDGIEIANDSFIQLLKEESKNVSDEKD